MDLPEGTRIDRYITEARIGEGGMAAVYRVRHATLGSQHALKVLTVSHAGVKERLVQEGRVQATLRHPNIVAVTDIIDVDGSPGLIMEFVDGPNLGELLDRHRPTLDEAEALATGIIEGVACAHKLGLIHRDLKPGNVLIAVTSAGPVPKVADFGLAKLLDGDGGMSRTRSGTAMGTPSYMAPEQIRDAKGVDKRADVFALGAILFELYTGQQAFPGEDILTVMTAIAGGDYPPPRELAPNLPDRVVRAITGALVVKAAERIPDCDSLLATLRGQDAATASAAPTSTPIARPTGSWSPEMLASINPRATNAGASKTSATPAPRTYALSNLAEPVVTPATARTSLGQPLPAERPGPTPSGTLLPEAGPAGPLASLENGVAKPVRGPIPAWLPALSVAVLGGLVVVALTWHPGGSGTTPPGASNPADPMPDPGPAQVATAPTPEPPAPASSPTGVSPAPTAATPAVQGASPPPPSPVTPPVTASTPRPAAPASTKPTAASPVAAPPAATTAPAPAVVAQPTPLAAPPPAEQAASPTMATVTVSGDAKRVWLESSGGRFPAGQVPPGTYKVTAFFDGVEAVPTGTITVAAGDHRELRCSSQLMVCR